MLCCPADTQDDGDLMQLLFGVADEMPTMVSEPKQTQLIKLFGYLNILDCMRLFSKPSISDISL